VRVVSRKRIKSGVDIRGTRDSSGTGIVEIVSSLNSEIDARRGPIESDKPENTTFPESGSLWNCSSCGYEVSGVTETDVLRKEGEILLGQRNSKSP